MSDIELQRKCSKCHATAADDANLRFHRFPLPGKHGPLKARVWAKYCYPDGNWYSEESLKQLHQQHKMLCSKHFDDSSYTSSSRQRLNNFAIPTKVPLTQKGILRNLHLPRSERLHENENFMESAEKN